MRSFGAVDGVEERTAILNGSGMKRETLSDSGKLSNGEIDPDDLMRQLEKENRDYQEQKQFISQQLSALKTQMYDLRKEEGINGASIGTRSDQDPQPSEDNNQIHVSLVRQTSHKHIAYNKVRNMRMIGNHYFFIVIV